MVELSSTSKADETFRRVLAVVIPNILPPKSESVVAEAGAGHQVKHGPMTQG